MEAYDRTEKELNGITYRLSIYQDEDPISPREYSNLGTMVCWHRGYNLGDEQPKESAREWLIDILQLGKKYESNSVDELIGLFKINNIVLPLYLYDHSGITMSTTPFSCRWDSGQVGFIYVSKKDAIKEYGKKKFTDIIKEKAESCLQSEVNIYNRYLRGDIYGFVIDQKTVCNLGHDHWESIDSCWGFYGSDIKENGMLEHFSDEMLDLFKEES